MTQPDSAAQDGSRPVFVYPPCVFLILDGMFAEARIIHTSR